MLSISREVFASELRTVAPTLAVALVLVVCALVSYCVARVQMARKYSKKNMPEQAQKLIRQLALKLRAVEAERDSNKATRAALERRLRSLSLLLNLPLSLDLAEQERLGGPYWRLTSEQVKDAATTRSVSKKAIESFKLVKS